jgi:hypothetical protein
MPQYVPCPSFAASDFPWITNLIAK